MLGTAASKQAHGAWLGAVWQRPLRRHSGFPRQDGPSELDGDTQSTFTLIFVLCAAAGRVEKNSPCTWARILYDRLLGLLENSKLMYQSP